MTLASAKKSLAPFVLLEAANFSGFFSFSMTFLLMPWLALSVTGSSASAGWLVTITSIPGLILSPIIGSFIDKFGRRRYAYLSQLVTALVSLSVPLIATFTPINLFVLIVIGVLRSIVGFGAASSRKSLVPDVADRSGLTLERTNSIHESIAAAGFATGPAVAAVCLSFMSGAQVFWVVGVLEIIAGLAAWFIRVEEKHEPVDPSAAHSFIYYATQGFRTLFKTPSVLIALFAFITLAVVYIPIEMVVLPRYFNGMNDPAGLGLLLTAMAGATSLSSLFFEAFAKWFSFSSLFRIALLGVGIPVLVMSFLPPYWAMLALGLILGFAWGPLAPLLNTVIQRKVPANERGRVFSLEGTIWSGGPMISMVVVGLAIDAFPLQAVYLTMAVLTLLAAVLVSFNKRTPELNTAEFED